MTYCQNCGHESHCEVPLMRDEHNYKKELLGQIEVCKNCRCEVCGSPQLDMFHMENEGT